MVVQQGSVTIRLIVRYQSLLKHALETLETLAIC